MIFENNDQAAHAVYRYIDNLRPSPQRFTLRPYQYQAPAFTEWWFVPSTEWPANRFSKLCFHRYRLAPEYIYIGFYVEQGLGTELVGLPDVKSSQIMQSNWYWHRFLGHMEDKELGGTLREVLGRSQYPMTVWVDAYEFNRV